MMIHEQTLLILLSQPMYAYLNVRKKMSQSSGVGGVVDNVSIGGLKRAMPLDGVDEGVAPRARKEAPLRPLTCFVWEEWWWWW